MGNLKKYWTLQIAKFKKFFWIVFLCIFIIFFIFRLLQVYLLVQRHWWSPPWHDVVPPGVQQYPLVVDVVLAFDCDFVTMGALLLYHVPRVPVCFYERLVHEPPGGAGVQGETLCVVVSVVRGWPKVEPRGVHCHTHNTINGYVDFSDR